VYGNRGCLHDDAGGIRRRYNGRRWIACRLRFRDRRRAPLLQPGRYTELFFLDEATAFSAGHRPCAECRRADYDRLVAIWRELHPNQRGADEIDAQLHAERRAHAAGAQLHHDAIVDQLPDGAFVVRDGAPFLVLGDELRRWTPAGYCAGVARPAGAQVRVITPPSLLAVLASGWEPLLPLLHPSAAGSEPQAAPPGNEYSSSDSVRSSML